MIRLFTTLVADPDPTRAAEYELCARKNVESGLFSAVYFLTEEQDAVPSVKSTPTTRVFIQRQETRPTFSDYFRLINSVTEPDSINVVANADIWFDQTLLLVAAIDAADMRDDVFCLTRWDVQPDGSPKFMEAIDSQDAWVWFGSMKDGVDGSPRMGQAGVDNRIAGAFQEAGYRVSNPSRSVKIHHQHQSGVRRYDAEDRVTGNYLLLQPKFLEIV